jgi:radical SAM superfamily enzyme YgiQ (UPF0313 family)
MVQLVEDRNTSIFLFQDDDFPVWGTFGRKWIDEFVTELRTAKIHDRVIWKISCRADEVDFHLFSKMRSAGLYMVYLGIESGTESGLSVLNKRITPAQSTKAVSLLAELQLCLGYGFMLFDPSTTFESIRENIKFLEVITGGGRAPVVFARMMPYAATPIEQLLAQHGRLRGRIEEPDYEFLDERVETAFNLINESLLVDWLTGPDSLLKQIQFAWQEYWILLRLFHGLRRLSKYEKTLASHTSQYNRFILSMVERVCTAVEEGRNGLPHLSGARSQKQLLSEQLLDERRNFLEANREAILACLSGAVHLSEA